MALPVTITGIDTGVATVGPFKSSVGKFYFFGKDGSTATTLQAYNSATPDTSWASIATKTGFTTAILNLAGYQVGDVIHLIVADGTTATSQNYKYQTFNMSSDTFVTAETIASALATDGQTGAGQSGCSIVVRSTAEAVVFFNGAETGGTLRARVYYSRRTGVNTWSAAVEIDDGGNSDNILPGAALGTSDRVYLFWSFTPPPSGTVLRSLDSTNVLDSTALIESNFAAFGTMPLHAVSFANGANTEIAFTAEWSATSPAARWFNSAANIPAGGTTDFSGVATAATVLRIFNDGTNVWLLYRNSADSDLYVAESTSNRPFGAATLAMTATVAAGDTNLSTNGNIYSRSSSYVIPYIVNDNGTLKYNEYVVRAPMMAAFGVSQDDGLSFTQMIGY